MTDGTIARGTVEHRDGYFIAIDTDGTIIGRFSTPLAAARAFDDGGAP